MLKEQIKKTKKMHCNNSMSCIYILGMIGAAIYFISKATTFGAGVVGFLKALVWPAYLVHGALNHLAL